MTIPTGIPTGVFTTSDGHINIAAVGPEMYRRLCDALGAPELIDDPRFKTRRDRSKNRKQMNAELDRVLASKTSAEWVELLNAGRRALGPDPERQGSLRERAGHAPGMPCR